MENDLYEKIKGMTLEELIAELGSADSKIKDNIRKADDCKNLQRALDAITESFRIKFGGGVGGENIAVIVASLRIIEKTYCDEMEKMRGNNAEAFREQLERDVEYYQELYKKHFRTTLVKVSN